MRDLKDNVIIICSIENFDPMGSAYRRFHVAPVQNTLADREYQAMRDAVIAVIREIGRRKLADRIFSSAYTTGRMVVIEMNPRVSRSSAAPRRLDFPSPRLPPSSPWAIRWMRFPMSITRKTLTLDYVVVKIPSGNSRSFPAPTRDADEVGGESDGDRTHFQGSVAQRRTRSRYR